MLAEDCEWEGGAKCCEMLNNFRNLQSLFWSHGTRWLLFRVGYALRRRTGYLRVQLPSYQWQDRPLGTWLKSNIPSTPIAYAVWRKQNSPPFFRPAKSTPGERSQNGDEDDTTPEVRRRGTLFPGDIPWDPGTAVEEAGRILSGELKYFSHTYYQVGFPPDWHKDPVTGKKLASNKHWSELSDDPGLDIKFIWEPSRFAMVYPLVRAYASTRDERFAAAFWELIQAWAESNPPNTGPNWMDGQEAALRLIAWIFGLYAFLDSPSTTPERVAELVTMVAAHAERIGKNIDYAISTHSNHAISEAAGLWLTGLLFPELKNAERYLSLGRDLLEQEAAAQIFPDGSYSMYSLNYHRFILHIYLYVIRLAEINQSPISSLISQKVESSIDYLSQLIDPQTGRMPVYGSNDGALVLPLNNCDFNDYRPLLQLGSYITKKQVLFDPGPWDEDIFWLHGTYPLTPNPSPFVEKDSFPHGGTHLLRGAHSKAVIRCTEYRSRPSHADQLHMDLWMRGHNITCDAGTYLYSGEGAWRNGLARTSVHNTVTVDHLDQMKMVTRFTWTNWSMGRVLRHDETTWQGEHDGYKRLNDPVNHRRTVLSLPNDRWLVVDHLNADRPHHYDLQWLLCDAEYGVRELAHGYGLWLKLPDSLLPDSRILVKMGLLEGDASFSIVRADPLSTRGWRSQYYGDKQPAISALLETDRSTACFWSFFGIDSDEVELLEERLIIKFGEENMEIDLNQQNK